MENLIKEAKQYIQNTPQDKKDIFMILCSLNLLNALIKKKEYKDILSYSFIKPHVSLLIDFCISNIENEYIDESYYSEHQHCVYIRCFGIQFSFHNITLTDKIRKFMDSPKNVPVEWDGIKLQPIAHELFILSKEIKIGNIKIEEVPIHFKHIIENKES